MARTLFVHGFTATILGMEYKIAKKQYNVKEKIMSNILGLSYATVVTFKISQSFMHHQNFQHT